MRGLRLRPALPLILCLWAGGALAQSGSVRTEVDARKIGLDDSTTLSIILEGDAAGLDASLPPLKNLRVVAGPSTSTQISFINGSMSRQKVFSFVLQAEASGPAEVGAVSLQGYSPTAPIAIEVVPGSIRPAPPQDPFGRDPFGGSDPFEEIFGRPQRRQPVNQGKLFVEAVLSRPAAMVGEPILVTYYVYTQISISGVEFAEAPKYPGFWAEEVDRSRGESTGESTFVQGETFLRYPVLERLLFPTRTGTLEIPEARLRLIPAGGAFGVAAPIERSTKVLKVRVNPLPDGAPEGSAVGSFSVAATTDRTEITLGDALAFRFKVSGRGNLKWMDAAPRLELKDARVFPPRAISDLQTTRQGIEGSKTWEFVVVPEKAGSFEIPSIPFSYFDLGAHSMKELQTSPVAVTVSAAAVAGEETPRNVTAPVALRADLDRPQGDLARAAATLGAISLLVQAFVWRQRSSNPRGRIGNKGAMAAALRELRDEGLLGGTKERAAARIAGALEAVFGPRAAWPMDDTGDRLRSLADDLEFLRFAPQLGSYELKLKEVRDRARDLIEALS